MIPFQPDPPPAGMRPQDAEWITRQFRRIADFGGETSTRIIVQGETSNNHEGRIVTLEQHPPRTDNPHSVAWDQIVNRPSCPVAWAEEWKGGPHVRCEMVRDGRWAMLANKDTGDRPAPQPIGVPSWVSDLPGPPAFVLQSATSSNLIVGQRYTLDRDGIISAVRYDRAEVSPAIQHELWLVQDPLGSPNSQKIVGPSEPTATGWRVLPQGQIFVFSGQVFDIFLFTRALAVPTSWTAEYDYKRSNGDPGEKEIFHQSAGGGNQMRINHTDEDENDRSAQLEALQVGDEISGGGMNWTITSTDHQLDHVRFGVDPASRASEGKYIFTFTTYASQPIAYNRADDHFVAEPQVQGFYSETGYPNLALDNHAYGVDIEVQGAVISPDWDLVAYSGG